MNHGNVRRPQNLVSFFLKLCISSFEIESSRSFELIVEVFQILFLAQFFFSRIEFFSSGEIIA